MLPKHLDTIIFDDKAPGPVRRINFGKVRRDMMADGLDWNDPQQRREAIDRELNRLKADDG